MMRRDEGLSRRTVLTSFFIPPHREFRARFCETAEQIAWASPRDRPREVMDCSSYIRYCYLQASGQRGNVFRVGKGSRAEFADAENLMRYNSTLVSQDLRVAQAADLLFYRQLEPHQPWHAMIYLGQSIVQPRDPARYLVYHTGPSPGDPGEIRRPSTNELLRHPEPRWRPVAGNRNFLGVFRWNILV